MKDLDTMYFDEYSSLKEAMRWPDWQNQTNTIAIEYSSLIENKIYSSINSPYNQKSISKQWVFNLKNNKEEKIPKYKAR